MVRAAALSIACLLLAGCSDIPHAWSRQEIIDISRANAVPQSTPELERRIDALEAEVSRLRQEQDKDIATLAAITKGQSDRNAYDDDSLSRLFKNDETFRQNVNALRAVHGWPPIATTQK